MATSKSKVAGRESLPDFIQTHHSKIVDEWVAFAATLLPWAKGLTEEDLRDHAAELLTLVVTDMRTPQTGAEASAKSKGREAGGPLGKVGQKHAIERLDSGLKLDQLISEYRSLRASVLRLWERSHDTKGEITRFNEAIDETLAESAVWYTEKMNRTREQFLAILGHDLRNPLGAIVAGAELLARSESIDDQQARVAARILTSAGRMARMVNDLLDLTRTRLGASIPIMPKAMDLTSSCKQAISELEAIHPGRDILFESTGSLIGVWDGDRLLQMISNLVANAVQHGREGGSVHVRAVGHEEEVGLQVHNEGPPIPKRALKMIFEPMTREPSQGGDNNISGLGLGLFIAREIVTAHGGTMVVTSTQKDGTTFTVQLPRSPASLKKAQVARAPAEQTTETEDSLH